MQPFLINASIQIVPIGNDKHPYLWVDEVISLIQQSGIIHEVGPFSTALQGTYEEVMQVIHNVQEYLQKNGCAEWLTNIQLQIRNNSDCTIEEKVKNYQ